MKAMYPGICDVCQRVYPQGSDIAYVHGSYVHASCAPGGDDE